MGYLIKTNYLKKMNNCIFKKICKILKNFYYIFYTINFLGIFYFLGIFQVPNKTYCCAWFTKNTNERKNIEKNYFLMFECMCNEK